ncbi:hypothetical protein [Paraburkholderia silvatlantica]|uniref:hypothetical protein n=1 Tax=Paraburkholderia silvatlantica TaxID=321895 RepID=UPI001061A40A|nr:hypothetical protein [Paraburkholderia silvatlantica]TDR04349.1 hypothetical protein C7412_102255 [Paraburkholderia silvatlantica]
MSDSNSKQYSDYSKVSPGKITDKEDILLAVVEPYNWESGAFSKQAFQKKNLIARKQSVARQCYSSPRRLKFFVFNFLLRKTGRVEIGVQRFNSRSLRDLFASDGSKQFVIADAPLSVNGKIDFAHAHFGFSDEIIAGGPNAQTAAVMNLRDFLENHGTLKRSRSQFPPAPFLYVRPSEFRLMRHRFRIWANGEGKKFINAESARKAEAASGQNSPAT